MKILCVLPELVKFSDPYLKETILQKKLFLIICEGKNTERAYFKSFQVPTKSVIVKGGCNSKNALVDFALSIKNDDENIGREIWCVFDYDVKPDEADTQPNDFNSSIMRAGEHGMKVAWSNDSFELWFVLHYQMIYSHVTRKELNKILKDKWELENFKNTAKTSTFSAENFSRHGGHKSEQQMQAINRARSLHEAHGTKTDFANQCPCTTVYLLVEELNKSM